jgi:hypothetical protein
MVPLVKSHRKPRQLPKDAIARCRYLLGLAITFWIDSDVVDDLILGGGVELVVVGVDFSSKIVVVIRVGW